MMLVGDGVRFGGGPMRTFAGVHAAAIETARSRHRGALLNFYAGEATVTSGASIADVNGRPSGAEAPYAWLMSPKGGGLAAFNMVGGSGDLEAGLALGKALTANLAGAGAISAASLSLIVAFAASLSGSSALTGSMRGAVQLAAELAGQGDIAAALGLIAWCAADLSGAGSLDDSNLTGLASLSAEILSYGELTPEGLRDAVWKAAAANFNDAGTMGAKLNSAASGGVDLNALAEAVWDHADAVAVATKLALLEKIARNKSITDPATGEFVLFDDDGTTELFRVPLWEDAAGTQAYRGQGAERKERLA